nr:MAG TPA: hypothetical protein [Caudoviricetes sp.]
MDRFLEVIDSGFDAFPACYAFSAVPVLFLIKLLLPLTVRSYLEEVNIIACS